MYLDQVYWENSPTQSKRSNFENSNFRQDNLWKSRIISRDIWRRLVVFSPTSRQKSIGAPHITQTVLDDNDLKDILDENLLQALWAICKRNQYNILAHPISDAMDYLQDVESTCTSPTQNSNTSSSHNGSSKRKSNGKGKWKPKVGKCLSLQSWIQVSWTPSVPKCLISLTMMPSSKTSTTGHTATQKLILKP